jgi:hypothetical protein
MIVARFLFFTLKKVAYRIDELVEQQPSTALTAL